MKTRAWTITDHACRRCFGRVLRTASAPTSYRCSICGLEEAAVKGLTHPPICACGVKVGGRDAGIRCVVNTPTPELPHEIVVKEI